MELPPAHNVMIPRKCLSCGKRFIAVKYQYVCCSWKCAHDYRKARKVSISDSTADLPYPF
jgi:hypothetical protein